MISKSSKRLLLFDKKFIMTWRTIEHFIKIFPFEMNFLKLLKKYYLKSYFLFIWNNLTLLILSIFSLIYLLCSWIFRNV